MLNLSVLAKKNAKVGGGVWTRGGATDPDRASRIAKYLLDDMTIDSDSVKSW